MTNLFFVFNFDEYSRFFLGCSEMLSDDRWLRGEEGIGLQKSLAQEVGQKSDLSERKSKAPFNPYFVCNTAALSLCNL